MKSLLKLKGELLKSTQKDWRKEGEKEEEFKGYT